MFHDYSLVALNVGARCIVSSEQLCILCRLYDLESYLILIDLGLRDLDSAKSIDFVAPRVDLINHEV